MTCWSQQPLLDLAAVDLERVDRVSYLLCQRFRYEYDAPAYDLRQRLVAVPRHRRGSLRRRAHRVEVSVEGADGSSRAAYRSNRRGNLVAEVRLPVVPVAVEFTVAALVEREGPPRDAEVPVASLCDPLYLRTTWLTRADEALTTVAAELRDRSDDDEAFAFAVCDRVRVGLTYDFGATSVATTAEQAWAIGRGVCQDAAHVMLAICRAVGVPARYVSGHLLGQPGGSHAWVEVLVADGHRGRAIGLDPSNGCRAGPRHLPVAVGGDYADVAPTSGWYDGDARGHLTCTKHAGVTAVDAAAF